MNIGYVTVVIKSSRGIALRQFFVPFPTGTHEKLTGSKVAKSIRDIVDRELDITSRRPEKRKVVV